MDTLGPGIEDALLTRTWWPDVVVPVRKGGPGGTRSLSCPDATGQTLTEERESVFEFGLSRSFKSEGLRCASGVRFVQTARARSHPPQLL